MTERSNQRTRVIFHLDMDAFSVSVEELTDPSLKGRPVVVGGEPDQRGVVAAASYPARKFGIRSAMPLRRAYQLCPEAVFVHGHPHRYLEYSRRVRSVLRDFSPVVEAASIDEAYLDMTGTEKLFGPPLAAAHQLHEAVARETSLPCSIGIGASRVVAKICSGLAKPNGVLLVRPGHEATFLAPLEVGRVPGVGKVMQRSLKSLGVTTIGEARAKGRAFLERHFGKAGRSLAGKAAGLDSGAWFSAGFGGAAPPKSIRHETTFLQDTRDRDLIDSTLAKLCQLVTRRLREHGLWARTLQLRIRYADFTTHTRAATLGQATQLDGEVLKTVRALFDRHYAQHRSVRLLGVQASALGPSPSHQLDLFDPGSRDRWERALAAVDSLRDRFGESAVGLAASLGHARRERVHENPAGLAGSGKKRKR